MAMVHLARSTEPRLTGRRRTMRSVPSSASPAIMYPATIAAAMGSRKGRSADSAASATYMPLLVTLSKNSGPSPPCGSALALYLAKADPHGGEGPLFFERVTRNGMYVALAALSALLPFLLYMHANKAAGYM